MTARSAAASSSTIARAKQRGYALLMAIFLVATMILLATVVTPSVLTEGRREREQEAIWRGNQYVRAIQLYYRKNGRYPQTVDDLIKGNLGVHFLRKAYTDPMNSEDGSWRFIYVSPTGQLIGSVRYHSLQEMALMLKMPGAGQALPNPLTLERRGSRLDNRERDNQEQRLPASKLELGRARDSRARSAGHRWDRRCQPTGSHSTWRRTGARICAHARALLRRPSVPHNPHSVPRRHPRPPSRYRQSTAPS